jgi:cardiolipin synthase
VLLLVIAVIVAYHLVLRYLLLRRKHQFVFVIDNRPLERLNISNILSLFRLSSAPTIFYLLVTANFAEKLLFVLPYVVAVFLTDLLDGYIARRFNQVTRIGQSLDSATDYFLLFSIALALLVSEKLPAWFFALVVVRFMLMAAGMAYVYLRQGFIDPQSSYLGKASIVAIMVVTAFLVLELALEGTATPFSVREFLRSISDKLIYMATGVVVTSCLEKMVLISRTIRGIKSKKG